MLQRNSLDFLLKWQKSKKRKPLLLRGARQVGKTTLVRMLAKYYPNYVELNLEKASDKSLFDLENIEQIINGAFLLNKISPKKGPTLFFIDEIQESPEAIKQIRYFYEERPDIHVIAAGSLLEFALKKVPSFPVGRIDYLYLHPINFDEYLQACHPQALKVLHQVPVPDYGHGTLLQKFHDYALIGGMPEVLSDYLESNDMVGLNKVYKKLWTAYKDDAEKYAKNNTNKTIIKHVIDTAPYQLDRIKFENFGNSNYRSREVGEALRALDLSKVIRLIYPTSSLIPPLISNFKKRPRLQFLDTGMLNQILLLQSELIGIKDLSNLHTGRIIEHLIGQELISIHTEFEFTPSFWTRENSNGNAEVDLVYQYQKHIIPIEIKSGKQGTLRSLHQFIERTNHSFAIRMYAGVFKIEKHQTPKEKKPYWLMNLPYYLGTQLPTYIAYFVEKYNMK